MIVTSYLQGTWGAQFLKLEEREVYTAPGMATLHGPDYTVG